MVNDFFALGKLKILAIEEYADMSVMTRSSLIGKLMVYETNY